MFKEILANIVFELRIRCRSISSYLYFLMFFVLAFIMTLAAGGAFAGVMVSFGTSSKVFINSPLSVSLITGLLTALNLFIIAPVFGQAICKDYINNFDQIVFTTPLKIRNFLLGRFIGATIFSLFIISSVPLGMFTASVLPLILPSMLTKNTLGAYLYPIFTIALPNILLFGSIFFFTGSRTRKMTAIYIAATLLFLLWSVSGQLTREIDNRTIATLIDPLGLRAISETTRYWTVDQQNQQYITFTSYFLWNRLLWLCFGAFALALTIFAFPRQLKSSKKVQTAKANSGELGEPITVSVTPLAGHPTHWMQSFFRQFKFEFLQTVKSIYFAVIVLAGVGYMFIVGTQVGKMFGTNTYPVTYNVLDFMGGTFSLFLLIIISLYTGESIWRDRDLKINQIVDATPVPNWVLFLAKYFNIVAVTALLLLSIMVTGILVQLSYGYTNFELGQYLVRLFLFSLPSYINLISLAFFFHVICKNKYLAHGLVVVYFVIEMFAPRMGFEHYLYNFNAKPTPIYSDMNGYGNLLQIFHLYNTYWLCLSLLLLIISYVSWSRGTLAETFRQTCRTIVKRMRPALRTVFVIALVGFVTLGSYLFYQTNIVNEYVTTKDKEQLQVDYEQKYKNYAKVAQPDIVSVNAQVDIFPYQQKMTAQLQLVLKNNSKSNVQHIFVNYPDDPWTLQWSAPATVARDDKLKVAIYSLNVPLEPGQELKADYTVEVDRSSIRNGGNIAKINFNGTFFNNADYFLRIGYEEDQEISSTKTRQKYKLPAKKRMPAIGDKSQRAFNYIGRASWIDFEAVVSTSPDQIAIAPGYLQKEWVENGRRYFHYKMDQKILNFYAFLSGRYEVRRDQWEDVNIEIYYHKGHEYNLDRMIDATKKSLDYFTKNFGPYQHKQYRIIEFPRYQTFAQAFPNTIPFSEGIGFIAKVDDKNPKDNDYPFYVTSHELAHQWWAHQLIGANVQGAEMLSETFAQYSALMVMEKVYGRERMRRFLQFELDSYLSGRGQEAEYENPMYLTEGQSHIHYNKGSVIFYALKDYLGEDVVNSAIRETLEKYGTKQAPYPTTLEFLAILKSKTPKDKLGLVEDMLEKIVLFENRPIQATAQKVKDQIHTVELTIVAKKLYADKDGKEVEKDFEQEMDIGVQDKDKKFIYLQKHLIKSGETKIKIEVDGIPVKAGVDPLNILIDRNSDDNLMSVTL